MDMPAEEVEPYSVAFWKYGPTELKDEWERVVANIEKGEKKIAKQKKLSSLLKKFVATFDLPRDEMVFANKGTTHFALEQDRALLCAVDANGYGNWDSVREEIRKDNRLKFQHTVMGMTTGMIAKRCDYRMRQMERELEAREKVLKNKRPPSVVAAQKAIEAIKAMEVWETDARNLELRGEDPPPLTIFDDDAAQIIQERLAEREPCIARLREIESQVTKCVALAEETRQAILRGDQVSICQLHKKIFFTYRADRLFGSPSKYVNYSSITLKAGGPTATSIKDGKEGGQPAALENGEIEALINKAILKVPECGQCANCIDKGQIRRLCEKRLESRKKLIAAETKRLKELEGKGSDKKKGNKKRKAESNGQTPAPKKMKVSPGLQKKKGPKLMKNANGQLKPRVTSQGNKRMSIPDDLFPEFCRRISAQGTAERMKLINQFAEEHPTISVRQVTLRLNEITTRDMPGCVKAIVLTPCPMTESLVQEF